jgi:DNA-binding PadR family transcriptional regulator
MSNNQRNNFLGEFEELVLLAILGLGKEAYGVPIAERIKDATGKKPSTGALYATLARLEEKNLIRSWMGEKTEERGGRAKKFFEVEIAGKQALQNSQNARKILISGDLELVLA